MSKKITFGCVRSLPPDAGETRIIPFTLSTPERDRYNTVLNQDNWMLDNFRKNPVVGYMHNLYGDLCNAPDPDDVVGQDKGTDFAIENGMRVLTGSTLFDPPDLNMKAEKIFRKLLLGSLRAVSVGFRDIGKGSYGSGEEAQGKERETYYFAGQELLEYSVVNIPGNASAGKRDMRFMRENTYAALMYAFRELGKQFRLSQIEGMRVRDVLDLLDGKDIEIRETDPEKVRAMLREEEAKNAWRQLVDGQIASLRSQ